MKLYVAILALLFASNVSQADILSDVQSALVNGAQILKNVAAADKAFNASVTSFKRSLQVAIDGLRVQVATLYDPIVTKYGSTYTITASAYPGVLSFFNSSRDGLLRAADSGAQEMKAKVAPLFQDLANVLTTMTAPLIAPLLFSSKAGTCAEMHGSELLSAIGSLGGITRCYNAEAAAYSANANWYVQQVAMLKQDYQMRANQINLCYKDSPLCLTEFFASMEADFAAAKNTYSSIWFVESMEKEVRDTRSYNCALYTNVNSISLIQQVSAKMKQCLGL